MHKIPPAYPIFFGYYLEHLVPVHRLKITSLSVAVVHLGILDIPHCCLFAEMIMPPQGAARFFIDLYGYSVIMKSDGCDTKYSHHTILEESKKEELSYAETQKARA